METGVTDQTAIEHEDAHPHVMTCKVNFLYDEYSYGLGEYYGGQGSLATALRDQAGFLEWHVEMLRKLADVIEEVGEEDIEFDVEELTLKAPADLVSRIIAEDMACSVE